jgi:seryl-tRNA synthetase
MPGRHMQPVFKPPRAIINMLDIRLIRERPDIVRNDLKKRGMPERISLLENLLKEDREYRKLLKELEILRHRRNLKTRELGRRKEEGQKIEKHRKELKSLVNRIKETEKTVSEKKRRIDSLLFRLPNILHESVPRGEDDSGNREIRKWGKIPSFGFPVKGHEQIGLELGILDIGRAAQISGARFYFLRNEGVLLDLALHRFALDFLAKKGFSLVQPPFMMRRKPYEGVVDLEDFEDVMYKIEGEDLYLIATSEHPLIGQYAGETLPEELLPLKLAGISTNFRKEAGSHGKDTKGIFRVHQFNKIEQIIFCRPEDSWKLHEELIKNAEEIFRKLEIPYRIVNVCTGDIGSIAAKKYDIEAWLPAQKKYREMGSCSNATDYQSRRLKIKYGKKDSPPKGLVHTLNSTAIVTRAMVAVLENYQQKDGSVIVPRVLRPYMKGIRKIEKS